MIKTAFCVSYDWQMLKRSLPRVYNASDIICLGLDKDRHTWACNPFEFDDNEFYAFVKQIDKDKKIIIYEDDFSLPELTSRENCNRHRHMMADKMGEGGWHIQVDADEYFLDFDGFVAYLKKLDAAPNPQKKAINIACPFIPLIKKTSGGYLYVDFKDRLPEIIPMATNKPDYQRARQNGHFNHVSPFYVIHETWARSEDELWFKINNWGHASEELVEKERRLSYFTLWKSLDKYNFQYIRDFHPATAPTWPALQFIEAASTDELLNIFPKPDFPYSPFQLMLRNNRNAARVRALWKKLTD